MTKKTDKTTVLLNRIAKLCNKKNYSLVTAESCTGGGLAFFITKNPQSSSLLERGYVTYSVTAKEDVLGVSSYLLQTFGAVSKEISIEMAEKALKKSHAQISISITGIDHKIIIKEGFHEPGIAWISCASVEKKTVTKKFLLKADREIFCEKLIYQALKMLYSYVK